MATEPAGSEATEASVEATEASVDATDERGRPRFAGCVFCYAGAWIAYAVGRIRDRAPGGG